MRQKYDVRTLLNCIKDIYEILLTYTFILFVYHSSYNFELETNKQFHDLKPLKILSTVNILSIKQKKLFSKLQKKKQILMILITRMKIYHYNFVILSMIYGRSINRYLSDFIFIVFPTILVVSWIAFLIYLPPLKKKSSSVQFENQKDLIIEIEAEKYNGSSPYKIKRKINLSETVAYIDMWRSHWCTYYNDREFFFTPRINEMLQRLRQFNVPVVTISSTVDYFLPSSHQRKIGMKAIKKGALPVLEEYNARAAAYHEDYIPGFMDECVYDDLTRYGQTRDNRYTPTIAIADNDYFVSNFKESAESFVGIGAKTVIIFGQHTNMCLMAVFLYCQQVNLDLIIVRDLVDSCWLYELQKNHVNTHSKGNVAVNNYFDQEFGSSILSYDLIRSLRDLNVSKAHPHYNMFTKHAHIFKYLI